MDFSDQFKMSADFVRARLRAAGTALEQGQVEIALQELEMIPPGRRTMREVLVMRTLIYSKAEAWELMRETARFLTEQWPEDSQHWIWVAYATRRCRSIEEAETWLLRAMEAHPAEPIIPFNLACYASVSGRLEEAKRFLTRAIHLDPQVREMVLTDPDLEPLWQSPDTNPTKP